MLRALVKTFAEAVMSAEAQVLCGAEYGEVSDERTNSRNGYRTREWDTRAGTIELAVPKLRSGSYFPDWLLSRRRRAEQALVTVVATSYLLGVSTRRVEKLCEAMGVTRLSKSQVSEMSKTLDEAVAAFRNRPLDLGPYRFCWADALVVKVREQGRTERLHVLVATGVNAEGHREILGLEVTSEESGAGWLAFFAASSRAGCRACASSPPTRTRDSSRRSEQRFPEPPGSAVERTTSATCSERWRSRPSLGWRRSCGRSSTSPMPSRSPRSSSAS